MENQEYPEQRYVVTALLRYILAAVLFVILVAFLAWFFFFRGTSDDTTKPAGQATQSIQQKNREDGSTAASNTDNEDANGENAAPGKGSGSTSTSGKTDASGESSTTTGNTNSTSSPDNLANTGPGDIMALFVVAVLVSTLGYRWRMLRKSA